MSERKVPKLRFPEFSGGWISKSLKSISNQISYGLTVRPEYIESGIPLISARELKHGYIDYESAPKISLASYEKLSEKAKAKNGDIFLTKTGTVGLSAYVKESFAIAITQNIAVIRIDDAKYDHQFILQNFKTDKFYKEAIAKVNQSTIMDLQLQDIRELYVCLPLIHEQTKIADFLTSIDDKIEQLTKKKELLEQYKKGVMRDVFSQKIRFKDDNGNDYPDWEEKILGDITDFLDGKRIPIKESERAKMSGKYPYYGASGIIDYINDFIFDQEIILLGEDGENIISRNLPLAFKVTGKCWVNNHAHVIIPNHGVHIDYLTQYLEQLNYEKYNTGTAQPKLNQEICKNIDIKLPNLTEQTKIAHFLTSIDDKITQVNMQLEQTKLFKKSLLQQMFI